jgi:hypothetical protein
MFRQDSVEMKLMYYFSLPNCGAWLSSQTFTYMLRELNLIPSTAQIEVNWLESLVEGLVVSFWVSFAIEVSILCVLGVVAVGFRKLYSLWAEQVLTVPQPLFGSSGAVSVQDLG